MQDAGQEAGAALDSDYYVRLGMTYVGTDEEEAIRNFTRAAEDNNAENLLVINDPVLAGQYIRNWRAHEQHSEAIERENKAEPQPGRAKSPRKLD